MAKTKLICQYLNDTFVVKCAERVKEPLNVVVDQVPAVSMSTSDWLMIGVGVLSAFGTGLAAWAAFKASKAADQANSISVRPELNFSYFIDTDENLCRVDLKNSGLGPAIITDFKIRIDECILSTHEEILDKSFDAFNAEAVKASLVGLCREEHIVSAGESHNLITLIFEEPGDLCEQKKLEVLKCVLQSYIMLITYTDIHRKAKFVKSLNKPLDSLITKN